MIDPDFLVLLRKRLRDDLLRRIVTDVARPAVMLLSLLRTAVPREMFAVLAGKEAVDEAERLGLLYGVFERSRKDLVTGVSVLRAAFEDPIDLIDGAPTTERKDADIHRAIAAWYLHLYRTDDDPRWLREAQYHTWTSGSPDKIREFGVAYRDELFGVGEYWFRRKEFTSALWAFQTALGLGLSNF